MLSEVDVLPEFGKKGIGTSLVKEVCQYARELNYKNVLLTTFMDIPWNYTFYKKLGFNELAAVNYSADIKRIIKNENNRGLSGEKRIVMIYSL